MSAARIVWDAQICGGTLAYREVVMRRRSKIVLVVAAVASAVLLFVRSPVQHAYLRWSVLHSDAPTEDALWDTLDRSSDPVSLAKQVWDQGKLVPRIKLLQYLRRHALEASPLWPGIRPIVLHAVASGDVDVAQSALGLLEDHNDPATPSAAFMMAHDPDPELRRWAIFYMTRSIDQRFVPILIPLLQDPDHSIQGCTQGALATLTGQDFGSTFDIDAGLSPSDINQWMLWWGKHQSEYATISVVRDIPSPSTWAALPDFSLPDLDGKPIRLADFRGKPIALSFWARHESNSVRQIPQWIEFQRRHPEIVVLAVSLDALTETHNHSHGPSDTHPASHDMHDHAAMQHEMESASDEEDTPGEDVAVNLRRFASRNKLNYRVLIDRTGRTSQAYAGDDPPVCLWIDKDGSLRRRTRITTGGVASLEAIAGSVFMATPTSMAHAAQP